MTFEGRFNRKLNYGVIYKLSNYYILYIWLSSIKVQIKYKLSYFKSIKFYNKPFMS